MYIPQLLLLLQVVSDGGDKPPHVEGFYPETLLVIITFLGVVAWPILRIKERKVEEAQRVRIVSLEKKAEDEPDKVRSAWEVAQANLEKYFQGNLNQIRMILYVAVFVMVIGFVFVLWGVHEAVSSPEKVKVAIIASGSGVITQFIGVTFMTLYRSTMLQATQNMSILERINTVGMAVQILDAMKDEGELKDSTRVDIIRLLLASRAAELSLTPRKRKNAKDSGARSPKGAPSRRSRNLISA
jgi:hypothetical protein